jgi:hypothetical protein
MSSYDSFDPSIDDDDTFAYGPLSPGERIGAPKSRGGGWTTLLTGLFLMTALGGGWALFGDQLGELAASLRASSAASSSAVPPASPDPAMATPAARGETPAVAAPADIVEPPPMKAVAALPAPAVTEAAPEPLRAPKVDRADPYQVKAVAAGLHPELSRALLSRLSAADYKNAALAIQTALAETADADVYVWPRKSKPELAVFEVHFVPGSSPDCRRYVVTVAKDGWATTALPLEKCGIAQPAAKRG